MRYAIIVILILKSFQHPLMAQETNEPRDYKNNVRFNLTNPIIFGTKSLIFGYERILNAQSSVSINIGQSSFAGLEFTTSDSLRSNSELEDRGYNFSVDYRIYLLRENKYGPPRGIYIGPYYSYNYFEKTHSWALKGTNGGTTQSIESKTSLSVHAVGFELGYQFTFWRRVSLDLILAGPGIASYNLKASLGANIPDADKEKFYEKLNEALQDKFPGYNRVIDEGEFQRNGSANTTRFGYRYMAMLGYRF